jgi:hypothetical protein
VKRRTFVHILSGYAEAFCAVEPVSGNSEYAVVAKVVRAVVGPKKGKKTPQQLAADTVYYEGLLYSVC